MIVMARGGPRSEDGPARIVNVYLDPPTARALEVVDFRSSFVGWLHRFHENLTIPEYSGRAIVGWVGIAMLTLALTGIWLWWPRNGAFLSGLRWCRAQHMTTNLHHLLGFWIAVPLAGVSLTGVYLSFPQTARQVMSLIVPTTPQGQRPGFGMIASSTRLTPEGVLSAALASEPGARPAVIFLPFVPFTMSKRGKQADFAAKTVMLAGRRYIVCRNHQEAEKDAADRASILAALERQLAKGDKALVGNTGYRRYLKTISEDHFAIDPDKVEDDKKFDGIFVLRTNTDLNPLEAMLCYKQLWTVEQTFRTAKHLLSTRPIFHKLDATIRGHVFCSFLALVLKKALEDRIAALARSGSWPQIIADLDSLTETEIEHDGKRFVVRSAPRPAASLALRAAGVALPPTVREAAAR